jgi:hypothetical protein
MNLEMTEGENVAGYWTGSLNLLFGLIPHHRRLKSINKQLIQSLKQLFGELIAAERMGRRGYGCLFEALLQHG